MISGTATALLMSLVAYTVSHALLNVRTSQATVAWTVGLISLPVIALPLYWVLARNKFHGYREVIREVESRQLNSALSIQTELRTESYTRCTSQNSVIEQVADVMDTPLSDATACDLLIDGEAFFRCLFTEIAKATEYIYLEFFIFRDDELGNQLAQCLIERAQSGVKVRMIYDEVGCIRLSYSYLQRLTEAGVEVHPFNTRQGWFNRFQINFRNHRKLVVIDGKTAIIGGLNIGTEYLGSANEAPRWRDTGIKVTGPVTRKVQAIFAGDYFWAARETLPEANWKSTDHPKAGLKQNSSEDRNSICCATGPADLRPRASMMYCSLANSAKSRLWISTPYLVPDEASIVALHMAKARGVDVRLLIPDRADHLLVYLAGFHYENEFTEASIPVYRYHSGFMHQKCILVDDQLAMIGSTNLDNRSLHLNFEIMIGLSDPELVSQVEAMLKDDFSLASQQSDKKLRWWYERLGTAVARLTSPIL
ncbi:MAG: cardiolipin synthase [Rhodopirellula sp.]|nr:cardiolipin synthase [Rhodopirellula sp.]